jgi:hypothetical protein
MSDYAQGFCSAISVYTKQLLHDLFRCYDTPRATKHNMAYLYDKYLGSMYSKGIRFSLNSDREYEWFYVTMDTRNTYLTVRILLHDKPNNWGYQDWWYDGPHPVFYLGPLVSIAWGCE